MITSASVMTEGSQARAWFVYLSSPEEATKAVTEMNGDILGTEPLHVALAQRKEEWKAILTNPFMQQRHSNVWALDGPLWDSFQQPSSCFLPTVPQFHATRAGIGGLEGVTSATGEHFGEKALFQSQELPASYLCLPAVLSTVAVLPSHPVLNQKSIFK